MIEKNREDIPFQKKGYTDVLQYMNFDYSDTNLINELYTSSNSFIDKKRYVAYMDKNITNPRYLKGKNIYANLNSHKDSSIYEKHFTNESVKIELEKSYLSNPRKATQEAISSILNELSKEYSITDEYKELFSSLGDSKEDEEKRKSAIFQLQKKISSADIKLLKGFQACDKMLNTLNQVENSDKMSISTQTKDALDELIDEQFSNNIPKEARKDFYSLIKSFDFDKNNDVESRKYTELVANASRILSPYMNPDLEGEKREERLKSVTLDKISSLRNIKDINNEFNETIRLGSLLNTKVKLNKDFVSLHNMFSEAFALCKHKDGAKKDYRQAKLAKEFSLYFDVNKSTFDNLVSDDKIQDNERNELKNTFNLIKNGTFANEKESLKNISSFASKYLSATLNDGVNDILEKEMGESFTNSKKQAIRKIVADNLIETSKKYANILNKSDSEFPSREINNIYNSFQSNTISKIISDITLSHKEEIDTLKDSYKEELKKSIDFKNASGIGGNSYYNKDDVVEVMNFNSLVNSKEIKNNIGINEIDEIAKQSLNNDGLKDFTEDIYKRDFKNNDPSLRRGLPLEEELRNIATHDYDTMSNTLLSKDLNNLFFKRETLANFSNCVQGSSVTKTGNETKMQNLHGCISKLTQETEQDSKALTQQVSQSLQGMGAINPFAHVMHIVALTRSLNASNLKRNIDIMSREMNKKALEVASAHTDIERRARLNILNSESNSDISIATVHDIEKNSLSAKIKQEYISKNLARHKSHEANSFKKNTINSKEDLNKVLDSYNIKKNQTPFKGNKEDKYQSAEKIVDKLKGDVKVDSIDTVLNSMSSKFTKGARKDYLSSHISEAIERNNIIQQKIVEMKILAERNVNNANFKIKENPENLQEKILKEWSVENNITQEELNTALGKHFINNKEQNPRMAQKVEEGISNDFENLETEELESLFNTAYEALEDEKMDLTYNLILESLKETKLELVTRETNLINLKSEYDELYKEFGSLDELPVDLIGDEKERFEKFLNLKNEILKEEDFLSNILRPRDKVEKVIEEIQRIFSNNAISTELEQRNVLSDALDTLHESHSHYESIEKLFNNSSVEVDLVKNDAQSENNILGMAMGEKSHLLRINQMTRDNNLRYSSEENRGYYEALDYKSDMALIEGSNESGTETSLGTWSALMSNTQDYVNNHKSNSEITKSRYSINQTLLDKNHSLYKKDESRNFSIDSLEMSSEESKGLQSSGIVM